MKSRAGNRMLASYAAWKSRTTRPLWSWQEDRLVDRFARALIRGRYRSSRPAAIACLVELESLRAKHPDAAWAHEARSLCAVRGRIVQRARSLGGRWPESHWSVPELRIAERHSRRFLAGRSPSMKQAARDCKLELDREFGASRGGLLTSNRPFYGVYSRIVELARAAGWSKPDGYWSPQEKRITRRYARGVVNGRYPSASAAARACREEFDRLRQRRPVPAWLARRREFLGISRMICKQAFGPGRPGVMPDWTRAELGLADRLARAILSGRCPDAVHAAHVFRRKTDRPEVHRSRRAIEGKICERARLLGRAPVHRPWASAELAVLDRYARGLDAGRFGSLDEAARLCRTDLGRLRSGGNKLVPPRTETAIVHRLRKQTSARGLRRRLSWSPAEVKVRDRWVRLYGRWRRAGDSRALGRAADGMLRDLARVGSHRSRAACIHQLTRRLRHVSAKT